MAGNLFRRVARKADSTIGRVTGTRASDVLRTALAGTETSSGPGGHGSFEGVPGLQRTSLPRSGVEVGARAVNLAATEIGAVRDQPMALDHLLNEVSGFEGVVAYYYEAKTDILRIATTAQKATDAVLSCVRMAAKEGFDVVPVPLKRGASAPASVAAIQRELLAHKASRFQFADGMTLATPFSVQLEVWSTTDEGHLTSPRNNNLASRFWHYVDSGSSAGAQDVRDLLPGPALGQARFDIDWVFTWVNGQDPEWQDMYNQYAPQVRTDASDGSRFEHRDDLKFALRSLDEYAPWIRQIHVVSNCKPPTWLDLGNPRINWVWHEELFDAADLPTFSSHAIETTLHKIPGLAEHFVYSNDDFYLARRACPEDFFAANGNCLTKFEGWGIVNGDVVEGDPDYLNAARNSGRLLLEDFGGWPVNLHTHSPQSLRVSILREMEGRYAESFMRTRAARFRTQDDIAVSGFLFHHYAFATGRGVAVDARTQLVQQNHKFNEVFSTLLRQRNRWSGSPKLSFCVNDGNGSMDNPTWNSAALKFLCEYFPIKSQFEK